jgi:hypothetical protein
LNEEVRAALRNDRLIDIVTTGAKSGMVRKTEIWFCNVGDRIIICGTPDAEGNSGPRSHRDWLANLKAEPEFKFCLKESLTVQLSARAVLITDAEDRRRLMAAPETAWYREQTNSVDELVEGSPIVEVFFEEGSR